MSVQENEETMTSLKDTPASEAAVARISALFDEVLDDDDEEILRGVHGFQDLPIYEQAEHALYQALNDPDIALHYKLALLNHVRAFSIVANEWGFEHLSGDALLGHINWFDFTKESAYAAAKNESITFFHVYQTIFSGRGSLDIDSIFETMVKTYFRYMNDVSAKANLGYLISLFDSRGYPIASLCERARKLYDFSADIPDEWVIRSLAEDWEDAHSIAFAEWRKRMKIKR